MTDKSISERLQNSIILYSALGILVIGVIVAFVSIMPLFNRLKKDEDRNLLFAVKTRTLAVEEYLSRAKDVALQITSRTKAREKLESYNKGEVTLDEFVNFSEGILTDALKKSKEVKGISRLDHRGNLVVQVGLPIPEELWPVPDEESREVLIHGPITLGGESYLVMGAPILDRQSRRVGTDIVLFKLTRLQQIVEDYTGLGETGETVLGAARDDRALLFFPLRGSEGGAPESFPKNSPLGSAFEKAFHKEAGILKLSDSPEVIAYGPIQGSDWGIVVKINKEELYAPVNRQIVVIGSIIVVLILLGTTGMVVLLRPLAGKTIIHTDELQQEIQEKTAALQTELNAHKRTEAALQRERSELQEWINTFDTFAGKFDPNGVIIFCNEAPIKAAGLTKDEVFGKYFPDTKWWSHSEIERARIVECLERAKAGLSSRIETNFRSADGTPVAIIFNCQPVMDDDGKIKYITAEGKIIIEEIQLRTELESFTYSVSHDLRAPLRAMQGFAQALLEDYADRLDPVGQDYAQRIIAAARHMDTLIQDLLAYSRLSRADLELQPVGLGSVVADVLAQLEAELQEREAQVTVEEPLPQVVGHHATLIQVVANLLTNAVKFVAPGVQPQVRIWAEERDKWVRLWVEDNGIGIAPEHQERIFRVFERLHGIEIYPGTGIGLAIVHKGTERMGGRMGVESEVGQESRFWIELPKVEEKP